jgi:hypothetical protein
MNSATLRLSSQRDLRRIAPESFDIVLNPT